MSILFSNPTALATAKMLVKQAAPVTRLDPESVRPLAFQAAAETALLENPTINGLRQSIADTRRNIEAANESMIRAGLARQQAESEARALYNLDWSQYENQDLTDVINARWEQGGRELYSIEQSYVDSTADFAATGEDYDERTWDQARHDRMVNDTVIQNTLDGIMQSREERNLVWGLFEMIGLQSLPLYTSTRQAGEDRDLVSSVFAGSALRDRAREFNQMRQQPPEVFVPWFQEFIGDLQQQATTFGYFDQSLFQQMLEEIAMDAPTEGVTNVFNGLDNAPLIGIGARAARRGIASPIQAIVNQGSRSRAADIAAQAAATIREEGLDIGLEVAGLRTKSDLLSSVSPRAFNTDGLTAEVSLAMDVDQRLSEARRILEEQLADLPQTNRLNPEEQAVAVERATTRLSERLGGRPVRDVDVRIQRLSDGTSVRRVSAWVGRADGRGFSSPQAAARYANSIGLENVEIRPEKSGDLNMFVFDRSSEITDEVAQAAERASNEFLEAFRRNSAAVKEEITQRFRSEAANNENFTAAHKDFVARSSTSDFVALTRTVRETGGSSIEGADKLTQSLEDFFDRAAREEALALSSGVRPSTYTPTGVMGQVRPKLNPPEISLELSRHTFKNMGDYRLIQTGARSDIALHELIHAATWRMYHTENPAFRKFQEGVDEVFDILSDSLANARKKQISGQSLTELEQRILERIDSGSNLFQNADELMAWGLSDTDAINYLKSIPYQGGRKVSRQRSSQVTRKVVEKRQAKNLWERLLQLFIAGLRTQEREITETVVEEFTEEIDKTANIFEELSLRVRKALGDTDISVRGWETERTDVPDSLVLGSRAVQDESGQWFVRAELDVAETGAYTRNLENRASNRISRFLLSNRANVDDDLINLGVVSANRRNAILRTLVEPYERTLRSLKGPERETLRTIWSVGNERAEWYSEREFRNIYERVTGVQPSNRVWNAYRESIRVNDMEWVLRNDALYKDKLTIGYETITFDTPYFRVDRMNGTVRESVPANEGVFDLTTGQYFRPGSYGELPSGWRVVRMEQPEMVNGNRVRTFVGPANSIRTEPLRRDQLGYRAGGHRMYRGDRFVKQAVTGTQSDGGTYWANPRTYLVGRTDAEVRGWADAMNRAREYVRENSLDDPSVARYLDDEVFKNNAGLPTGEEFVKMVNDGRVNLDEPFEVLNDRELPSAYSRRNPGDADLVNEDIGAYESWLGSQNRMYYGSRGDALPDFTGRTAPVLDLYEMMNVSLRNIANLSSMTDFKAESMQRWARTYGKYTDVREGASPAEIFVNGQLNVSDPRIRESAEATRESIRNILGWRSEEMTAWDGIQRQIIDTLAGETPGTNRAEFAAQVANWVRTQNPQAALTGAAFDMKLGLFNIAQFPLQISQMAAITALSPKYAGGAWMNHAPAYVYFLNGNERIIDSLISRGWHRTVGFDDPEEYRGFMRYLRSGGYTDVGGNQVLINEYGTNAVFGGFGGRTNQIREAGRFFFYQAEVWNRIMGQHVAWREVREKFPDLEVGSPEFIRKLAGRADDYTMNMTRETGSWWQRGATAVPTQFWSYSARMMEAMLTDKFDRAARFRLFLSQSVLYGTSGIMGYTAASWVFNQARGALDLDPPPTVPEPTELMSLKGLFERGLVDQVTYMLTGQDVLVGERYGTGNFVGTFLRDVSGDGEYGEVSVAEFLGGASMSIWWDTIFKDGAQFARDVFGYFLAERGATDVPHDNRTFQQLAMNISSVSNALKAYYVARHNVFISSSGTRLVDAPSTNAWMTMLSYNPAEVDEISDYFDYMENRDQIVNELAGIIRQYRQRMLEDPENARDYMMQIGLLAEYHRDEMDLYLEARRIAFSNYDPDMLSGLERRMNQYRLDEIGREGVAEDGATD